MYFKDSGIEWIGHIPAHWRVEKLKRILECPLMYGTNEVAELDDTEFPRYVRITDFDDNGLLRDDTFKSLSPDKADGYYLGEGDVLFARSGATVGKSFLFKNYSGQACFAGYLIKAQTNRHSLLPEYLYYFTKSPSYDSWKNIIFTQTTIQNISATKYAYLPITVPSLDDQKHIIAYLDKTCAAIDTAIDKKQKQLETLDALRKSIIHKAITRGLNDAVELKNSGAHYLGKLPSHWKVDRLKNIVNLRNSKIYVTSEEEDYLELEDIEQGTGKILSKRNTVEVESAVTLFKKGDILFGKLRPYLEKYYLAEFDGKCTGEILAFEPLKIQGRFLLYCISSTWFIGQCNMLAYGAKMPRVNWPTQLAKINFPLPLKDEQVQIADYLDDKCGEIGSLKKNIVDQIFTLDQYRKSLIHECVTGKRRITEDDMKRVQQY